jgi:hypothetical protein
MSRWTCLVFVLLTACNLGAKPDASGDFPNLFPKTPLSKDICLNDEDCVMSALQDGQCCPDPCGDRHLHHRDKHIKLVKHIEEICDPKVFSCPEAVCPEDATTQVGKCIEKRCVQVDALSTSEQPAP